MAPKSFHFQHREVVADGQSSIHVFKLASESLKFKMKSSEYGFSQEFRLL